MQGKPVKTAHAPPHFERRSVASLQKSPCIMNGIRIVEYELGEMSKQHLAYWRYCPNEQIYEKIPDFHLHVENKPRTSRTRGSSTNHLTVLFGMESQFKLFSITLRDICLVVCLSSQKFGAVLQQYSVSCYGLRILIFFAYFYQISYLFLI